MLSNHQWTNYILEKIAFTEILREEIRDNMAKTNTKLCSLCPKDGQGLVKDIEIIVQYKYPSLFIQSIPQSPPYPTLPLFFSI